MASSQPAAANTSDSATAMASTLENGCLWGAPGGHHGPLRKTFTRTPDDHHTTFEVLDPTPLPEPPEDLVPLEVEAGTMDVLDGRLPHWSDVNRSDRSRYAYTVHCIAESADYPSWNWLRRGPDLPLRRLDQVAEALTR